VQKFIKICLQFLAILWKYKHYKIQNYLFPSVEVTINQYRIFITRVKNVANNAGESKQYNFNNMYTVE